MTDREKNIVEILEEKLKFCLSILDKYEIVDKHRYIVPIDLINLKQCLAELSLEMNALKLIFPGVTL